MTSKKIPNYINKKRLLKKFRITSKNLIISVYFYSKPLIIELFSFNRKIY